MSGNPQFPQTRKPLNPDAKAAPLFDYMPQMSLEERNRRWDKVRKKVYTDFDVGLTNSQRFEC